MLKQKKLYPLSFVVLSFLSLYALATSTFFASQPTRFSILITVDVLITIPLIYFLLIRKSSIPKVSVIPITLLGVVMATYILPKEQQYTLGLFIEWVLPVLELMVLSFILYNVFKTIKGFRENTSQDSDFYTVLKKTCHKILPSSFVIPFVTEISVFYYGFIYWKKREINSNEFTYHKESSSITLFVTISFLIVIETFVLHILLSKWSTSVAWILTTLSIYTVIQLIGFSKSIVKRPIFITNDALFLRYGIMKETRICLKDIVAIELTSKDIENNQDFQKLSLLGSFESHNTIIHLNTLNSLSGLYGMKKPYRSIALSLDDNKRFKRDIEQARSTLTSL